jgi:Lrp/AsnC family transcriptional regulator for asnA, asnC and gidA
MAKNRIRDYSDARNTAIYNNLDERDREILRLLISNTSNRAIATKLKIPMSTVQRRTRRLFEKGIVRMKYELNHKKLGFRKGLLHVYLKDGNLQGIAEEISKIRGMESTSIHIGNSDIVGLFIFSEASHLLDIMSECKKIEGVDHVLWSEEVMNIFEPATSSNDKQLLSEITNPPSS